MFRPTLRSGRGSAGPPKKKKKKTTTTQLKGKGAESCETSDKVSREASGKTQVCNVDQLFFCCSWTQLKTVSVSNLLIFCTPTTT
jgi:hypothetical protein